MMILRVGLSKRCPEHSLSQDLETGCPNRGFIDFWVSKVWYKINTTNEINPLYLQNLLFLPVRPFQFNYLSYELFLEKKSCQTPKKKKKKVNFGVLRTKVVSKFYVRLQKKKKKKCMF